MQIIVLKRLCCNQKNDGVAEEPMKKTTALFHRSYMYMYMYMYGNKNVLTYRVMYKRDGDRKETRASSVRALNMKYKLGKHAFRGTYIGRCAL